MFRKIATTSILAGALALAGLALPGAAWAGDADAGKALFMANACFTCHGETGDGNTPMAAALDPKPRNFQEGAFKFDADGDGTAGGDADLMQVIASGAAAFGGSALMAPYAALSETDRANLVAFIRTLKK